MLAAVEEDRLYAKPEKSETCEIQKTCLGSRIVFPIIKAKVELRQKLLSNITIRKHSIQEYVTKIMTLENFFCFENFI